VAAGVVFSLLSAIVLNTGNIVQKHAVSNLPEISGRRSAHLFRTLVSSRIWLTGLALCVLGVALQVMAFALAPIPVVQAIFNAGLVLLIVLSRVRLGERFQRNEWIGLAIVVIALTSLGASLTGSTSTIGLGGSALRVMIAAVPTLLAVVLVVAGIRLGWGRSGFLYGIAAGILYGMAALGTKGASTLVVGHGLIPSIPNILASVYPYVFLVFSALGMIAYQTGIQRFRIAVVGSMSDVVASTYIVVVGMVVFGESLPKDTVTLTLRLIGFTGVLVGSVLVALGGGKSAAPMPPIDSDLGLGSVLVAEADRLIGHPVDEVVAGNHPAPPSSDIG
jgi:multidrug transporter EmrE-like cation transporter